MHDRLTNNLQQQASDATRARAAAATAYNTAAALSLPHMHSYLLTPLILTYTFTHSYSLQTEKRQIKNLSPLVSAFADRNRQQKAVTERSYRPISRT